MIITIRHLRALTLCGPGAKKWFDAKGLDWKDFIRNGIEEEKLIATGDAFALKVVEAANNKLQKHF